MPAGIIPAYAGSTFKRKTNQIRWQDHPRLRGEHSDAYKYNGGLAF